MKSEWYSGRFARELQQMKEEFPEVKGIDILDIFEQESFRSVIRWKVYIDTSTYIGQIKISDHVSTNSQTVKILGSIYADLCRFVAQHRMADTTIFVDRIKKTLELHTDLEEIFMLDQDIPLKNPEITMEYYYASRSPSTNF